MAGAASFIPAGKQTDEYRGGGSSPERANAMCLLTQRPTLGVPPKKVAQSGRLVNHEYDRISIAALFR